jgi:MFS family permease
VSLGSPSYFDREAEGWKVVRADERGDLGDPLVNGYVLMSGGLLLLGGRLGDVFGRRRLLPADLTFGSGRPCRA